MIKRNANDISATLYVGLPVAMILFIYVSALFGGSNWLRGEIGFVELLTSFYLLSAIFYLITTIRIAPTKPLRRWLIFLTLGTIYFAGEEMSWGQVIFEWQTPETWKQVNDQDETNIHNTWFLFDQFPRMVMTLAVLIGGIIVPIYRSLKKVSDFPVTQVFTGWFPTIVCLPVSILAIVVSPIDDMFAQSSYVWLQKIGEISGGELKECYLGLFILIYVISLKYRLRLLEGRD